MSLNPSQRRNASLIYQAGVHAGLAPNRALELVAASYAESGLDAGIRNRAGSGAAGLFQLLSPGYVNKANALGGVFNPSANIHAILPDYVSYWRSHPNAVPGEAAAAVERSGMGPSFYAGPLRIVSGINRNVPLTLPAASTQTTGSPQTTTMQTVGQPDYHLAQMQMAQALIQSSAQTQRGQNADIPSLLDSLSLYENTLKQPAMQAMVQRSPSLQPSQQPAAQPPPTTSGSVHYTGASLSGVRSGFLRQVSAAAEAAGATQIRVISGYRSPAHNAAVGGVPRSNHMTGNAIDAEGYVPGRGWIPLGTLLDSVAARFGLRSGDQPGFYRGGRDPNHVDNGANQR